MMRRLLGPTFVYKHWFERITDLRFVKYRFVPFPSFCLSVSVSICLPVCLAVCPFLSLIVFLCLYLCGALSLAL